MESSGLSLPPPQEWWRLCDAELTSALTSLETLRRQVDAQTLAIVTEATTRGLPASLMHPSMVTVMQDTTSCSRSTATKTVRRAAALQELPSAAAALASGSIGVEHLDAIYGFRSSLSCVDPGEWDKALRILADLAESVSPEAVRRFANSELRPRLDPDGAVPKERDLAQPCNELSMRFRQNGWMEFKGKLEPASAALWAAIIAAESKPDHSGENGLDLRTVEQRQGDALEEWIATSRAGQPLPAEGGERPQVTVTIGLDALLSGLGYATLGPDLLPISVSEARRLACDCQIVPITLSAESVPIEIGRASRNIPTHIRRLVANRDRGCAFPGCDRPGSRCQVHHIQEWQHGGVTEPHNLALLCRRHHRVVHHSEWEVRMSRCGRPEFIPPGWLDPARRPRINLVHRMLA
jgi:hypothetical protein